MQKGGVITDSDGVLTSLSFDDDLGDVEFGAGVDGGFEAEDIDA